MLNCLSKIRNSFELPRHVQFESVDWDKIDEIRKISEDALEPLLQLRGVSLSHDVITAD